MKQAKCIKLNKILSDCTGISSLTMLDSIKLSQEMNMKDFDFNGANSFVGSDDKHHYGSNYRMYFEINSN